MDSLGTENGRAKVNLGLPFRTPYMSCGLGSESNQDPSFVVMFGWNHVRQTCHGATFPTSQWQYYLLSHMLYLHIPKLPKAAAKAHLFPQTCFYDKRVCK